ncbi:hypothetical protein EVB97_126 [Rhizobium phage RHph_Y65]|uniref:Uncharacterized protein n=1 Tax=Rhizobium phage RHph_Y65 TaxID=2509785 RepID=A0A7S5UXC0_9CAUD|nr:hypothetical protein PQC17_gp126 [Rhizobium phage RHph_Y65]QIG72684.1 hypothetical protein EVB97_126 [Rhizobium phage RHph_Y65]
MADYIRLYRPEGKGVCLEFARANDYETATKFADLFKEIMPKKFNWFHQGGTNFNNEPSDWHLFEFWGYDSNPLRIRCYCVVLADMLGLSLMIHDSAGDEVTI